MQFGIRSFIDTCLSYFKGYWYMLSYSVLVLISPLINNSLGSLHKEDVRKVMFTSFMIACLVKNILKVNVGSYLISFILIYVTVYYLI